MKKQVLGILLLVFVSILFAFVLVKRKEVGMFFKEKKTSLEEAVENEKEILQKKKEGYVVLKDSSLWLKIAEDKDTITLLSAFPVSEKGEIKEEENLVAYHSSCENCNIEEETSDLQKLSSKLLSNITTKLGIEQMENTISRFPTREDLVSIGCKVEELTCEGVKELYFSYPFWTSMTISGTNEIFVVDEAKNLTPKKATDKTNFRVVIQTSKQNIY